MVAVVTPRRGHRRTAEQDVARGERYGARRRLPRGGGHGRRDGHVRPNIDVGTVLATPSGRGRGPHPADEAEGTECE